MKRPTALVAAGLLIAAMVPAAAVSAADPNHVRVTRTGAGASFEELKDGLWVTTDVGAADEASSDVETSPMAWLIQAAYAPDESGDYNQLVWSVEGRTADATLTIDSQLASATISAPSLPITRCDALGDCVEQTADVAVTFTSTGSTQHSHQRAIGSISRQSLFVYNNVGAYRFATATVSIDGTTYGPSTGPADANIFDTRTGWIDITFAAPGETARPGGIVIYDTGPPPIGRQTGESMYAAWLSETDGIGRNSGLAASAQRISSQGKVVNRVSLSYWDQVYAIDEWGSITPITETFSLEGGTVTTIAVDRQMVGGTVAGAAIPALSCTYIDAQPICVETVVRADGQWTGVGPTTKTRDGSTAGVAGVLLIVYHNASTHRAATAAATIDGVAFSNPYEASMDRGTTGFHEVHIGD